MLILTRLQLRLADAHTFTCEWRSCAFADTNIDIDTGYSSALPTPTPSQASLVCLLVSGQSLLCLFCVVVDLSYDFVCVFLIVVLRCGRSLLCFLVVFVRLRSIPPVYFCAFFDRGRCLLCFLVRLFLFVSGRSLLCLVLFRHRYLL